MKKLFKIFSITIFLALGCFFSNLAYAETEVSGNITGDTNWTSANSPYTITETVQVLEGVILEIEPGVIINFNQNTALVIGGKLIAIGTEGQKITFHGGTITFDDKSIDAITDQDNNYVSGSIIKYSIIESGKIMGLNIYHASPYIGNNIIRNYNPSNGAGYAIDLDYSNSIIVNNLIDNNSETAINVYFSGAKIRNNIITNNLTAFQISGGNSEISRNIIKNNNYGGFYLQFGANPKIQYNNIFQNGTYNNDVMANNNIWMAQNTDIQADHNYWGTTDTSIIESEIHDYYDLISLGKVIYEPLATAELDLDDQTAPIFSRTEHSPSSPIVGQQVLIHALAADDYLLANTKLYLDGVNVQTCNFSGRGFASADCPFETTTLSAGSHTYYAVTTDSGGNTTRDPPEGTKSFTVTGAPNTTAVACTSFAYSDWSTCQSNGTKTRTVISSSPNGCSGGNPALTQSCTYTPPACTSWTYSGWGICANNQQTRTITSSQPASCTGGNPVLNQSCDSTPLCVENNWTSTLTPTSCPNNNQQTKKWTKIGQCQGGIFRPSEETVSCDYQAPTCTNFTYSDWGACSSSGVQSRTTLSASPSGCTGGNSVLSKSCNYVPPCTSDTWSCGDWSDCLANGSQTRICTKTFDCPSVQTESPTTNQHCEISNKPTAQQTTQNNSDESLSKDQEKNTTGSQVAEQRRSDVANAVQEILQVAERDSGIGQQVKIIAQTQTQNQEKLEASLQKVQSRSGFTKFFVGPDYGEINNAKKLLEQNREQIKQLNQVKNQLSNQDDQQKLTEQVQLLEQSNQEIENSLNTSQKGFSLFGWMFKLFVKI